MWHYSIFRLSYGIHIKQVDVPSLAVIVKVTHHGAVCIHNYIINTNCSIPRPCKLCLDG